MAYISHVHPRRLKQEKNSFPDSPISLSALELMFIFHFRIFFFNPPINFEGEKKETSYEMETLELHQEKKT